MHSPIPSIGGRCRFHRWCQRQAGIDDCFENGSRVTFSSSRRRRWRRQLGATDDYSERISSISCAASFIAFSGDSFFRYTFSIAEFSTFMTLSPCSPNCHGIE